MTQKTITLLMPVSKFYSADSVNVPPYALLYIGTALEDAGYNVRIFHENGNVDEVVDKILAEDNLFIGISAFTGYPTWLACQYAKKIKERSPDTKVMLGGYHASMLKEQVLHDYFFDYIVFGEGEETAVELADALSKGEIYLSYIKGLGWKKKNGEIVINDQRPMPANIDYDIDWSLIDLDRYVKHVTHLGGKRYFYIFTSRGCPATMCSFCAGAFLYKRRYRKESMEHIIKTYKPVLDKYDVELIEFLDDNFLVDIEWAEKVAVGLGRPYRALLRLDRVNEDLCEMLNRTNCRAVFVGVESGNERFRNDIIHKNLTDNQIYDAVKMLAEKCPQINISAMFIAGIPGEKYSEFRDTCRMAIALTGMHPRLLPQINVYAPYPMCESYIEAVKRGWNPPQKTEEWDLDPKPGRALDPTWLDYYTPGIKGRFELTSKMFILLRRDAGLSYFKNIVKKILREMVIWRMMLDFYFLPLEVELFWIMYLRMIKHDIC